MILFAELIVVLSTAIVIHEATHYFYAIKTGNFVGFDFEDWSPTIHFKNDMNYENQLVMYGLAILNGLIVVIPFIFLSENGIMHVLTMLIYLCGCNYDINQFIGLIKRC